MTDRTQASGSLLPPCPAPWGSWREVMRLALTEAFAAQARGEVPVGAVVLSPRGEIVGRAGNSPVGTKDPTAHAEVLALRQAAQAMGNYRLTGCLLVVTLEPCVMCVGAMVQARLGGLVFGAHDERAGGVVSTIEGFALPGHNHRVPWLGGILEDECAATLKRFFLSRRKG